MHSIVVTPFSKMCTKRFERKALGSCTRSSYSMITLVHIRQILWMGRESVTQLFVSPDLVPCDYHLFGPMKGDLGGQKFQNTMDSNVVSLTVSVTGNIVKRSGSLPILACIFFFFVKTNLVSVPRLLSSLLLPSQFLHLRLTILISERMKSMFFWKGSSFALSGHCKLISK
jgi:hypothetical protein